MGGIRKVWSRKNVGKRASSLFFSAPKAQPGTISFPPDFISLPYEKGYSDRK